MNYRHVYHAGNFADVVKHAVLALVIAHLKRKSSPFRVIDTHAGLGRYDLTSVEALKTGEAREGIGRVLGATFTAEVSALICSYLDVVRELNRGGQLETYPGSPWLARSLIRPGDMLVANELHADDLARLKALYTRDDQVKVLGLDAWVAIKSLLPPKERRGVVLIDPPFENPLEFDHVVAGLRDGLKRFATGTFMVWLPIKDQERVGAFKRAVVDLEIASLLDVSLLIRESLDESLLNGCGMVIVNPPFELDKKLKVLMPALARVLSQGDGACAHVTWLCNPA